MEEIIQRIVIATGVSEESARKAVVIILNFLNKEGPSDRMQEVFNSLPGAQQAIEEYASENSSKGGLFGGLSGMVPGMGAMAVLNELSGVGLEMSEVQKVARELVAAAREKAGDEAVDEVISAIPVLKQVL